MYTFLRAQQTLRPLFSGTLKDSSTRDNSGERNAHRHYYELSRSFRRNEISRQNKVKGTNISDTLDDDYDDDTNRLNPTSNSAITVTHELRTDVVDKGFHQ